MVDYTKMQLGKMLAEEREATVNKVLAHLKQKGRGFITPNEIRVAAGVEPVAEEQVLADFQSL